MKYVISGPPSPVQDTIYIPSSKSISNRMLILRALSGSGPALENLSASDDTRVLAYALNDPSPVKDVGHAGTAMRFLTAYFAAREEQVVLTGSERMKRRPIGTLVDALRQLGARIEYQNNEGYPPLKISGGIKAGGTLTVEGGISSQFISALMMIGPVLKGGLHIILKGNVVSAPYIEMTLALMKKEGIQASFDGKRLDIPEMEYNPGHFIVESDWSGASYWYQVAALLPGSVIRLPYLTENSLQGDSVLADLFSSLGIESRFDGEGVTLSQNRVERTGIFQYDFTGCPDLVQTLATTLCVMGIHFRFSGTRTLRIKETDRIHALQVELGKLGYTLEADDPGTWIRWSGTRCDPEKEPVIRTYHDHRMAMAFAPLAIPLGSIRIDDPMVVTKSYPGYWADLEKAGFTISGE